MNFFKFSIKLIPFVVKILSKSVIGRCESVNGSLGKVKGEGRIGEGDYILYGRDYPAQDGMA